MKRIAFLALSIGALAFGACKGGADDGGAGGGGGEGGGGGACQDVCQQSSQCPTAGLICTDGCCVEWAGCTPGSCAAGEFCNPDTTDCETVTAVCDTKGPCECTIVGSAGRMPDAGLNADITLGPDATMMIEVLVTTAASQGGDPIPGVGFDLALDVETDFEVTGGDSVHALTGGAGGTALLTATIVDSGGAPLIPGVTCDADLTSLGDAPATGVRFYAFNDVTGDPVDGATIIVDSNDAGVADAFGNLTTPASGVIESVTALDNGPVYNVSVFANGYNYISLVGITANDVAIPLSPRGTNAELGGFDGVFDFSTYEQLYLDNQEKLLKAGIVAASFPLRALLNFDFEMFIGTFDTSLDCEAVPMPVGCYEIEFPGFSAFKVPLPGGVVLDLTSIDVKPNFDVTGVPGRRYAWSLGGEAEITDIADFIPMILDLTDDCTCDDEIADSCPATCDCDEDCPLALDFGQIFDGLLPLLSKFASGVQGGIPMDPGSMDDWEAYAGPAYDERIDSSDYPRLDDANTSWNFGQLVLRQNLARFTTFDAPTLPDDPAAGVDATMEAFIVLTGVDAKGAGFIPLGLAAGLDCTAAEGRCLDRDANPDDFDGEVNGSQVCVFNVDPTKNQCPAVAGDGAVAGGNIGMFSAPPHSGLEDGNEMTVALALPLSSFFSDGGGAIRTSAWVDRGTPDGTSLANATFPPTPDFFFPPVTGGVYEVTSTDYDLSWVTFASDPDLNGDTTRWNVYYGGSGGNFVAPDPGGVNPLLMADGNGDIPEGAINVTHIGFDLESSLGLDDLATNDSTTLLDVINEVKAFAVTSSNVCQDTGCP